ncbi:MAG: hypothetical protein H6Q58_1688 [Firmicutes bacterium]|nr:hypothetical protein [Bacillota bacterium]
MNRPLIRKEIDAFFSGQEERTKLYLSIEEMIKSLGPLTIEIMKSQISFGTKYKFAWVWIPPDSSKKRPKNSIVLSFGLDHRVESKQIAEAVEPYPGRWTHHIIIQDETELNTDVYKWLRQAYAFSQGREKK